EAYYGLGGIYNYQERYQEAAEAFETAIRLDPTHHNSYYSLGYTYEQLGRNQEAEKKYRKYRDLKARYDQLMKHQREKR
ncbi:MAG: tetratricopeptide repeat protein, partial [Nitrospinaceae bacterium]|nr:tetratricopeptide repeat protein [Nitrospinaceae bacterium]